MTRPSWTSEDARARLREVRLSDEQEATLRAFMGERVKDARKLLGASRQDVAESFGKSVSWIREIELGNTWAPHALLQALASALGTNAATFYSGDPVRWEQSADASVAVELRRHAEKHIRPLGEQSVQKAAAVLDVSVGYVWKLVGAGKLATTKKGRNTLVTADSLVDYYASQDHIELTRKKARRRD